MSANFREIEPTLRAVLKIRLDEQLDAHFHELVRCSRHERAERVRDALQQQLALMAFEKRDSRAAVLPRRTSFMTEGAVFVGVC